MKNERLLIFQPLFLIPFGVIIDFITFFMHKYIEMNQWPLFLFIKVLLWLGLGVFIKRLYLKAYTDELTNIWNRKYLYRKLTTEMKKLNGNRMLSVAFLDADNFKYVNDTYGHLAGDRALVELVNIMKSNLRKGDIVVRWGGEEFVMILPNTDKDGAIVVCERIRKMVEHKNLGNNLTISIGIASIEQRTEVEKLLEMADKALYQAKKTKNLTIAY